MKKALSIVLIVVLEVTVMFGFTACGKDYYKVDYCGKKACYTDARDSYKAGKTVTLYYEMIATDTDYSFYLDGEYLNFGYDEGKGFVIKFVMPEHDVKLECKSVNSMLAMPDGGEE